MKCRKWYVPSGELSMFAWNVREGEGEGEGLGYRVRFRVRVRVRVRGFE